MRGLVRGLMRVHGIQGRKAWVWSVISAEEGHAPCAGDGGIPSRVPSST
ncbi:hypothetical protein STXM2123_4 [Streptomyces sp. F-3]|nr:hypothetical protein STXM2123_4 [Streptomyces sp. F-3]